MVAGERDLSINRVRLSSEEYVSLSFDCSTTKEKETGFNKWPPISKEEKKEGRSIIGRVSRSSSAEERHKALRLQALV